ncbi:MAG: hypothetical protein KAZ58_02265 [Arenimonas sp.]|jgi:hypothetical protein|uniref:hypothetical protein n=1 Tax=Arenimonas sp. TaxID=1872635 RepID=UPI001B6E9178|nr:hypothetical protein [Arenimonas sp.]
MRSIFHRLLLTRPNKPRNPVLKAVFSVLGLFFLFGVCVFAIFVGVFMLVASFLLKRLGKKPATARSDADVLNAEYTVIEKSTISLSR